MRKTLTVLAVLLVAVAMVGCRNKPPRIPLRPIGPDSLGTGDTGRYRTVSTDPNRDQIQYVMNWADNTFDTSALFRSGDTVTMKHVWTDTGWFALTARARDEKGNWSVAWSDTHMVHVYPGGNRRPYKPDMPAGPDSGWVGQWQVFTTKCVDPNGDSVSIVFVWDEGQVGLPIKAGSGVTVTDSVKYLSGGMKYIRAVARDPAGLLSDTSDPKAFKSLQTNTRPDKPVMSGPLRGIKDGPYYRFYATSTDPQRDRVQYKFFCGSDTTHGWTPLTVSGTAGMDSFRFTTLGSYGIRAIARDEGGLVSETSMVWTFQVVDEGTILWYADGDFVASPALGPVGSRSELRPGVICGDVDGYLIAIDAHQGEGLFRVMSSTDPEAFSASPTLSPTGVIYNGNDNGQMMAFTNEGAKLWDYPAVPSENDYNATAVIDATFLYVGGENLRLQKLDISGSTPTELWSHYLGEDLNSSPALLPSGNIVACDDSGYVTWLDQRGNVLWRYGTGASITSSPAVGPDGTIYFGTDQGKLVAMRDGSLQWTYDILPPFNDINSSPTIDADGNIYFGADNGTLYKLAPDGNLVWSYVVSSAGILSSPALAQDGVIYVVAEDEKLYAINPNGTERWSVELVPTVARRPGGHRQLSLSIASSPAIDGYGVIYVGSSTGLYAIAGRSGAPLMNSPWPMFHRDVRHTGKYGSTR